MAFSAFNWGEKKLTELAEKQGSLPIMTRARTMLFLDIRVMGWNVQHGLQNVVVANKIPKQYSRFRSGRDPEPGTGAASTDSPARVPSSQPTQQCRELLCRGCGGNGHASEDLPQAIPTMSTRTRRVKTSF